MVPPSVSYSTIRKIFRRNASYRRAKGAAHSPGDPERPVLMQAQSPPQFEFPLDFGWRQWQIGAMERLAADPGFDGREIAAGHAVSLNNSRPISMRRISLVPAPIS